MPVAAAAAGASSFRYNLAVMAKRNRPPARRRGARRNPGEYFLAALGLALLALIVAMVFQVGACQVRLSPELVGPPPRLTPTPADLEP